MQINKTTAVTVVMAWTGAACAGPEWIEGELGTGDAGSQTGTAQVPQRDPLTSVRGVVAAPAVAGGGAAGDFEDLYLIQIVDPFGFSAQTVLANAGLNFNTQLWLFDVQGLGLLANDDLGGDTRGLLGFSLITPLANDGTGQTIPGPGLYFLGISGFNNDPSSAQREIFFQAVPNEISGPDGPGGALPLNEWSGPGEVGDYLIVLDGAAQAFENQCPEDVNGDGIVDNGDVNQVQSNLGPCTPGDLCTEDVNGDGIVDVQDVLLVLAALGPCPPQCGDFFAGPCFLPHPGPACENAACCAIVCFTDAFCCEVQWDPPCAAAAAAQCPQTPFNDQCSDRIDIADGVTAFSTIGATTDGPAHPLACNFFGEPQIGSDIWFNYVASCDGTLIIDTCAGDGAFDTELAVYDGCACPVDDETLLACNDDTCGLLSQVLLSVIAGQCYKIRVGGFNGAQGSGLLTIACQPQSSQLLFDTGPHRAVLFNAELTNLGFSNGFLSIAQPQRWNAERFSLPALPVGFDAWQITQFRPEGFIPVPPPPVQTDTLEWTVWSHVGDLIAPTPPDELAFGSVPVPAADGDVFPIDVAGLVLPPGEYWLNVHGANGTGGAVASNFAWFCNPDGGIALIDPDGGPVPPGAFHWRSGMYPLPGFIQEAPPNVVQQAGLDPDDRYKKAFAVLGVPVKKGPVCGAPGSGSCCAAHPNPGCDDPACCKTVCALDPFCCEVSWDSICATEANDLCAVCANGDVCDTATNDCCVAGGGPGCNQPACCASVCAIDPFCCDIAWDGICASEANADPNCDCGGDVCDTAASDCCVSTGIPGCNQPACCASVCAADPFCCDIAWDSICASEANADPNCDCGGDVCDTATGDCCVSTGIPGCNQPACCASVCAIDPFCCDVAWDSICANSALISPDCDCGDPDVCATATGDCCSANGEPGCNDPACCNIVCGLDPFCCDVAWDNICADEAAANCGKLCGVVGPANDNCADRIDIGPGTVVNLAFDTTGATTDGPAHPAQCNKFGEPQISQDIWYNWTSAGAGPWLISLCGSSYDTEIAVYDGCGCPVSDGNLLACNDDTCGLQSEVTIDAVNNGCYKIRVGGFGTATGAGVLNISFSGDPDSCAGNCGGSAPGGCFCDAACCGFSDCCPDEPTFCGQCADCNKNGVPDAFEIATNQVADENGNGVPDECECLVNPDCLADVNDDGIVNGADLGQCLLDFAVNDGCPAVAGGTIFSTDLNGDGIVNGADLGILLLQFTGNPCP